MIFPSSHTVPLLPLQVQQLYTLRQVVLSARSNLDGTRARAEESFHRTLIQGGRSLQALHRTERRCPPVSLNFFPPFSRTHE